MPGIDGNIKSDPYGVKNYTMPPSENNTLNVEGYFKLLAAQLANQDMMNPMDNSEMLNQMTQMTMVKSIANMTEGLKETQLLTRQSHAFSMLGKTVTVIKENEKGVVEKIEGEVEKVELLGQMPRFKIKDHDGFVDMKDIYVVGSSEEDSVLESEEQ